MLENGAIALGDDPVLLPWHLRVNLGTEGTSVLYTLTGRKVKSLEEML